MSNVELNVKQKELVSIVDDFGNGRIFKDKPFITLSGAGGSGKTFALNIALQKLMNEGNYIMGGAISNSATSILEKSIDYADVRTLSKLLKERKVTGNLGNEYFTTSDDEDPLSLPIYKAKILAIDECSMIGPKHISNIQKYTRNGTKIIYIGDRAQHSVIETGKISETFKHTVIELDEVMRSDALLNDINSIFRSEIISLLDYGRMTNPYVLREKLYFTDSVKGDVGYYNINNRNNFIDKFIEEYKNEPNNPRHAKIISYTKDNVNYYNKTIRERLYGVKADRFIVGDNLIIESSFYDKNTNIHIPSNTHITVDNVYGGQKYGIPVIFIDAHSSLDIYPSIGILEYNAIGVYKQRLMQLEYKAKTGQILWKDVSDFKSSFARVSYGFAVNSHKVQGDTLNCAFVCETEIKNTTKPSDLNKLQSIYVATTRSKYKTYLF